jgi:hypothetical protein
VQKIEGEIGYRPGGVGEWQEVTPNTVLTENDEIFIGVDSKLTITLPDGGTFIVGKTPAEYGLNLEASGTDLLRFDPNDSMGTYNLRGLATREGRREWELDLIRHYFEAKLNSLKDRAVDTNFEIQTPTATCSVRG